MPSLTSDEIPELLSRLVDKSLVQVDADGRYDLLQLVRSFAQEELVRAEDSEATRRKHLAHYANRCSEMTALVFGPNESEMYELVAKENDNLRAAAEFATSHSKTWPTAVRILSDTQYVHFARGSLSEGLAMAKSAIHTAPEDAQFLLATAWACIATFHQRQAHPDTLTSIENAISLGEETGNQYAIYVGRFQRAVAHWRDGEMEEGNKLGLGALEMARLDNNKPIEARLLNYLGIAALYENEIEIARRYFNESLAIWNALGHVRGMAVVSSNLGHIYERLGDYKAAYKSILQSMSVLYALGDYLNVGSVLSVACSGFWVAKDYKFAAMLLGCGYRLWDVNEAIPDEVDRQTGARWRERLLAQMGEEAFLRAVEEGRQMPLKDAVDKVVSNPEPWVNGSKW